MNFGIGENGHFRVLLDGSFIFFALKNNFSIEEQIPKLLKGKTFEFITTSCVIEELEKLGESFEEALDYAKRLTITKCKHKGGNCIQKLVGNSNEEKVIVCTQDGRLRTDLRKIPGVPLILLNQVVPVLEPPSEASKSAHRDHESQKTELSVSERKRLRSAMGEDEPPKKKRKKKGVNPLSCLKSTKAPSAPKVDGEKPKNRRKKRRKSKKEGE